MTSLETRYRRLLGAYPADHRRVYAEEMLGVLLAGARPGQRCPDLGEAADLLCSGMRARAGRSWFALRSSGWRDAAAVAALVGAALLAASAGRRLLDALVLSQDPDLPAGDLVARTAVWLLVFFAVATGLRRSAVVLGVGGLLVEAGAIVAGMPGEPLRPIRMSWAPMLAALVVTMLVLARRGRPAARVLGIRGTWLTLAPAAVALWGWVIMLSSPVRALVGRAGVVQILGLVTVRDMVLVTAAALVAAGLWCTGTGVRGRLVVLLVPLAAVPLAQELYEFVVGMRYEPDVTVGLVVADILVVAGLPLLAAALAATVHHGQQTFTISVRRRAGR
ncbi:hypothetical protein AB0J80_34215 [Actinoplanes sp. NPDC049548]|uniref:hypothetical protein n=1 Tax=Actinoplanes sp. NPDC049548 TaxID=3155152 RepID=UPI00343903A8